MVSRDDIEKCRVKIGNELMRSVGVTEQDWAVSVKNQTNSRTEAVQAG